MATADAPVTTPIARTNTENLPAIRGPRLPYHPLVQERFGIDKASWKALVEAIFPTATSVESVILALSYCKARKLDPFKRNVHIVPIWNSAVGGMIDTVWPGIGELRTTAFRTGEYAGRGETVFGPDITCKVGRQELTFPEWAQVTVYRMVKGTRVEFCGPRVYWLETYAQRKRDDETPNEMWLSRPRGQIDKCAEAAALRAAFPEEIGSDYIPEEVQHGKPIRDPADNEKPSDTLESLTERLEQDNGQKPQKEHVEGAWQTFVDEISAAESITDATAVYDRWFGPEAQYEFTPDQNAEAARLRDKRHAEIRSARGSNSNKQKTMLETSPTAQTEGH
jgi:phage recombination protein Bet